MENDAVDEIVKNVVIVNNVPRYTLEYIAELQAALKKAKNEILDLTEVNEELADDLRSLEREHNVLKSDVRTLEREIQRRADAATY